MSEAEKERAAVVAWLRDQSAEGLKWAGKYDNGTKRLAYGGGAYALSRAADEIEACNHLKEKPDA